MREIKFRAWSEDTKEMFMVDEIMFSRVEETNKQFFVIKQLHKSWDGVTNDYNQKYEKVGTDFFLMQYTGLKDKNDKEVYEGDILEVERFENDDNPMEVVFEDASFYVKNKKRRVGIGRWYAGERIEVIGNIYENPTLANKELN